MSQRPTPTDVLAAIFALAESGRFRAEPAILHGAFFVARDGCPELDGLDFAAPPRPRSEVLAIGLDLLKAYGTIAEAASDTLTMSGPARRKVERDVLPKFSTDEIARLKRAAAVLDAVCGIAAAELPHRKGRS